jgi:hypothetical protein
MRVSTIPVSSNRHLRSDQAAQSSLERQRAHTTRDHTPLTPTGTPKTSPTAAALTGELVRGTSRVPSHSADFRPTPWSHIQVRSEVVHRIEPMQPAVRRAIAAYLDNTQFSKAAVCGIDTFV